VRKLKHISDIHLEINAAYDVPAFIVGTDDEDLMINGDTTVTYVLDMKRTDGGSRKLQKSLKKLVLQVKGFRRVFFVLGNHEHYNGNFQQSKKLLEDFLYIECGLSPDQFIVLDNTAYELDAHTILLGATLWTDMGGNNDSSHYFVGRGMNDFRLISFGDDPKKRFSTYDAYNEHQKTLAWMTEQLEKYKDKRVIVATHHAPSFQSEGRYHGNSMITDGYCSNLTNFILEHPNITNWIHGHTHVNVDYKIGECHVTSNMRGYVDVDWYCKFDEQTFKDRFVEY
jgi:hypothetical protein